MYNVIENKSKIYYNGSIHPNKYGKIEIINKIDKKDSYMIKFEDGIIDYAKNSSIKKGNIKNKNYPSVFNIGYIGYGEYFCSLNGKQTKEYVVWNSMLRRCYSKYFKNRNKTYNTCTVDERWHNFQNFCEDIQELDGYSEWVKNNNLELDKDIKQKNIENKIYSKNTCIFITAKENIKESADRNYTTGLKYIATRLKDSYSEVFTNQRDFCKKYNLQQAHVNRCINNKPLYKTHKGWKFQTLN